MFNAVYGFYLEEILTRVAKLLSSDDEAYDYLIESIREWYDQETLGKMIAQAGWERVQYRNYTGGILALHRAVKP